MKGKISEIREAYDSFLSEFPLCYVYWKKYADHELSYSNWEDALHVYEKGVTQGSPVSVDLWTHYCSLVVEKKPENIQEIRNLFERAVSKVGRDWTSHILWDKYLEFEATLYPNFMSTLYLRILSIPMDPTTLQNYYEKWRLHVQNTGLYNVGDLFTPKELERFEKKFNGKDGPSNEVEIREQKYRFITDRSEDKFQRTMKEIEKRKTFESIVQKRPYFHFRPLDELQQSNWRKYLEFEESELQKFEKNKKRGNQDIPEEEKIESEGEESATDPSLPLHLEKVVKLYERCLVACCNYPEFWYRYVRFLESRGMVDQSRSVLHKAATKLIKRRPDIHFHWALFEETHQNPEKSREIYENLIKIIAPNHTESIVRYASFERRQGNSGLATSIYETAIASTAQTISTTLSLSSSNPLPPPPATTSPLHSSCSGYYKSLAFLYCHFARFHEILFGDPSKAREIYNNAVDQLPSSKTIWLAFISFENNHGGDDMFDRVSGLYERALKEESGLSDDDTIDLWQHYLNFDSDFGNSPVRSLKLERRFMDYLGSKNVNRKRYLENEASEQTQETKFPKTYQNTYYNSYPQMTQYPTATASTYGYYDYSQYAGYQYPMS